MGLEYLIDLFEYPQVHFKADIMTYDRNNTGGACNRWNVISADVYM